MQAAKRLFLVGPMGAGKSTVGRHLASLLGWQFVDSDHVIEERTGADIPWIFEIEGENGFRDREQKAIADLSTVDGMVLATGGGAVMREQNRAVLKEAGSVVYLRATVREQVRRTGYNDKRPLLIGRNRHRVLRELMQARDPLYRDVADLVVTTEGKNARKLAEEIICTLRERALLPMVEQ